MSSAIITRAGSNLRFGITDAPMRWSPIVDGALIT